MKVINKVVTQQKKRNSKQGNTIVSTVLITGICIIIIFVITIYIIKMLIPFIVYEKMNKVSQKYMFIVEKYGYLTKAEKENLKNDLKNEGFNIENIMLEVPENKRDYGELVNIKIEYNLYQKLPIIERGIIKTNNNLITIRVQKYSYIKN